MLKRRLLTLISVILLFSAVRMPIMSAEEEKEDLSIDSMVSFFYELEDTEPALELDSNNDGEIDYLVKTGVDGEKEMEVLDYNHDGKMDDFYIYDSGVLEQRAIDSNSDGMIDIKVYLEEGVYILHYEEDSNFDGEMDVQKRYAPDKEKNGEKQ